MHNKPDSPLSGRKRQAPYKEPQTNTNANRPSSNDKSNKHSNKPEKPETNAKKYKNNYTLYKPYQPHLTTKRKNSWTNSPRKETNSQENSTKTIDY